MPVTLLGQVSEQPGVIRVREIVPPQPVQTIQRIIGHGPAAHGSPAWNQAGLQRPGRQGGIIDLGFRGLTSLMGTELPATVQARCYTDIGVFTQNLADCEAAEPVPETTLPECRDVVQGEAVEVADHGTIVAESVLDIAPAVELYIAQPGSRADLQDASEWMASQGVSVINYSVGWIFRWSRRWHISLQHQPSENRGPVGGKRSHVGQLRGQFWPDGLGLTATPTRTVIGQSHLAVRMTKSWTYPSGRVGRIGSSCGGKTPGKEQARI